MKYLVILLALGMLAGCLTTPDPKAVAKQFRDNALNICNYYGLTPETEKHRRCMMEEFQNQANAYNAYQAQRRAAYYGAWSRGMNSMSNSFYQQSNIYSRPTAPIYKPMNQTTSCNPNGAGGFNCTTY